MKMTLKKFAADPKHIIKKSPIIILVNREPTYAIIPYMVYKAKFESESNPDNKYAALIPKRNNFILFSRLGAYLYRLLFVV